MYNKDVINICKQYMNVYSERGMLQTKKTKAQSCLVIDMKYIVNKHWNRQVFYPCFLIFKNCTLFIPLHGFLRSPAPQNLGFLGAQVGRGRRCSVCIWTNSFRSGSLVVGASSGTISDTWGFSTASLAIPIGAEGDQGLFWELCLSIIKPPYFFSHLTSDWKGSVTWGSLLILFRFQLEMG